MTEHAINHNHKPTATPPSAVIAATDNQFLPPSENDDENDADKADLIGNYDGGGKNRGKGGHFRRYRDHNKIEGLHGLYGEQKDNDDNGHDFDENDCDWYDTKEKEWEEYDDGDDDVVDIATVQFFGMPDEAFLGKKTENKKKEEEEEEKRKGGYDS